MKRDIFVTPEQKKEFDDYIKSLNVQYYNGQLADNRVGLHFFAVISPTNNVVGTYYSVYEAHRACNEYGVAYMAVRVYDLMLRGNEYAIHVR